jgi:FkbM family methyltransferase
MLTKLLIKWLNSLGIGITTRTNLVKLINTQTEVDLNSSAKLVLDFIKETNPKNLTEFFLALAKSKSQLRQDLFVLLELDFLEGGYYVEFGATNGVDLSNTHLLEKEYLWKGILVEPARIWHNELQKNRPLASIEESCVWRDSITTLRFNETFPASLSTIDEFSQSDLHANSRLDGTCYEVQSISLYDLLKKHGAPREIDYLSLDTEGSEFEILNVFDFSEYCFKTISCEHNFTENRVKIHDLLIKNGYQRKYENISDFDDWYVYVQ